MDQAACYLPSYSYSIFSLSNILGIDVNILDIIVKHELYATKVLIPSSLVRLLSNPSYLLYFDKLYVDDFALRQIKAPYSTDDFDYVTKNSILDKKGMSKFVDRIKTDSPMMLYPLINRLELENMLVPKDIELVISQKSDILNHIGALVNEPNRLIHFPFKRALKKFTTVMAANELGCPIYGSPENYNFGHIKGHKIDDTKSVLKKIAASSQDLTLINNFFKDYDQSIKEAMRLKLTGKAIEHLIGFNNPIENEKQLQDIFNLRNREYLIDFRQFIREEIEDLCKNNIAAEDEEPLQELFKLLSDRSREIREKMSNEYSKQKIADNISSVFVPMATTAVSSAIGLLIAGSAGAIAGGAIGASTIPVTEKFLKKLNKRFFEWRNQPDLWYYYINPRP